MLNQQQQCLQGLITVFYHERDRWMDYSHVNNIAELLTVVD